MLYLNNCYSYFNLIVLNQKIKIIVFYYSRLLDNTEEERTGRAEVTLWAHILLLRFWKSEWKKPQAIHLKWASLKATVH